MADDTVVPAPTPAPILDYKDIAAQVFGVLKAKVSGYLKDHADTQALLLKWSEQIAKLMVKRVFADAAGKAADDEIINLYKQAMKLELDAVVLDAEGLGHSTLTAVLDTLWEVFVKVAPVLIKLAIP